MKILIEERARPAHLVLGGILGWALSVATAFGQVESVGEGRVDEAMILIGPFSIAKPPAEWDTQETRDHSSTYKWVLHRSGVNPVVWLRFDETPTGETAHDYAESVARRLASRGIEVKAVRRRVVSGRNVSLISGVDPSAGARYLIGVWRNKDGGLTLECTAAIADFAVYEPQCMTMIRSVEVRGESGAIREEDER